MGLEEMKKFVESQNMDTDKKLHYFYTALLLNAAKMECDYEEFEDKTTNECVALVGAYNCLDEIIQVFEELFNINTNCLANTEKNLA